MVTFDSTYGGNASTGTIQSWTVPSTGSYFIEAWGASGGRGESNSSLFGKGAYVKATFSLTAGHVIKILVGQAGAGVSNGNNYGGGGGGGSFVVNDTTGTPLLVAAGGNGGSWGSHTALIPDAKWSPFDSAQGVQSADGRGGTGGTYSLSGNSSGNEFGGSSFVAGGTGGIGTYNRGGFGGGGGSQYEGGGGGGWVGGKGPPTNNYTTQGIAALSYSAGSNTTGQDGARTGDGQVVISSANTVPVVSITAPVGGQQVDPRLPFQMTWTYSDAEGSPQMKYEAGVRAGSSTITTAYSPTNPSDYAGTIQTWVVPETQAYRLTAQGASGAYNTLLPRPGYGAILAGDFTLAAGDVIKILVGQVGRLLDTGSAYGLGGGGGTFIYNQTTGALLLAAGGGGGPGGNTAATYRGCDASLVTAPNNTNGTFANGSADAAPGAGGDSPYYAGGGAGWNSNAQGSYSPQGGYRMLDPTYPGRGGYGYSSNSAAFTGGFGGGGGGSSSGDTGGGGGGYTGGNGGSTTDYPGGGGGSYIHVSATSTSAALATAVGNGSATIETSFSIQEVVSSNAYHNFLANALPDETAITLRVRVHDGTSWSDYATVDIISDSWTYGDEIADSSSSGALPDLPVGQYEAQVRTADAVDFGQWSEGVAFTVLPTSNVKIYQDGAWHTVPNRLRLGGSWVVPPNPERL